MLTHNCEFKTEFLGKKSEFRFSVFILWQKSLLPVLLCVTGIGLDWKGFVKHTDLK